ncbi:GlxA family transcriptional regulator, partial [Metapseudomonas otitidis]
MAGHQVALVVFPDFQLLDATGPAEVFAAASEALPKGEGYALRLLSPEGGLVRSSTGLALMTEPLPAADELAGATLLVA